MPYFFYNDIRKKVIGLNRWREYNPNPQGKSVGDCVIRALTAATGESWERMYMFLTFEGFCRADWGNANHVWGRVLRQRGFKRGLVRDDCETCYTVNDFAEEHPTGVFVLAINGHVVCVKDGYYYDSWDSGNEVPLYYWYREDDA